MKTTTTINNLKRSGSVLGAAIKTSRSFPLDASILWDATLRPAHHILREMFDRVGVLEYGENIAMGCSRSHWRFLKPKTVIWFDWIKSLNLHNVTETESIWLDQIADSEILLRACHNSYCSYFYIAGSSLLVPFPFVCHNSYCSYFYIAELS